MHNDIYANATNNVHSFPDDASLSHSGLCSDDDGHSTIGERALWRAVITQALMDISSNSKKVIDKVERARALAWFSARNPDFLSVCSLADLDPKYVLKKVKEAIARGGKWRKEPGQGKKEAKQKRKPKNHQASVSKKAHPARNTDTVVICQFA